MMFGMSQDEGAEDAALEAALCELGEEALHGVEPGRRGSGEVESPAGNRASHLRGITAQAP
jgi:hypothetical protein